MLTAEGNGEDVWGITNPTIDIPFGAPVLSTCGTIAHGTDTPIFIVMETGDYTIEYHLAARHDGVSPDLPIDLYADLISSQHKTLDTIHFTEQNQMIQKKIITHLDAGDDFHLQGRQTIVGEMIFSQQKITISKICA
jgi:hypothetical protein